MNIIGRLTKNAEIIALKDNREVVNFSVAVNDGYKGKQGERVELTEYYDCSYWISPKIAPHLTKGTLVELSGRTSARAWIGKDGLAHAGLNFHISQIRFLARGGKAETAGASPVKTATPDKRQQKIVIQDDENEDFPQSGKRGRTSKPYKGFEENPDEIQKKI